MSGRAGRPRRPSAVEAAVTGKVPSAPRRRRRPGTSSSNAGGAGADGAAGPVPQDAGRLSARRTVAVADGASGRRIRVNPARIRDAGDSLAPWRSGTRRGADSGQQESDRLDTLLQRLESQPARPELAELSGAAQQGGEEIVALRLSEDEQAVVQQEARLRLLRAASAHGWATDPVSLAIRRDQSRRLKQAAKQTRRRCREAEEAEARARGVESGVPQFRGWGVVETPADSAAGADDGGAKPVWRGAGDGRDASAAGRLGTQSAGGAHGARQQRMRFVVDPSPAPMVLSAREGLPGRKRGSAAPLGKPLRHPPPQSATGRAGRSGHAWAPGTSTGATPGTAGRGPGGDSVEFELVDAPTRDELDEAPRVAVSDAALGSLWGASGPAGGGAGGSDGVRPRVPALWTARTAGPELAATLGLVSDPAEWEGAAEARTALAARGAAQRAEVQQATFRAARYDPQALQADSQGAGWNWQQPPDSPRHAAAAAARDTTRGAREDSLPWVGQGGASAAPQPRFGLASHLSDNRLPPGHAALPSHLRGGTFGTDTPVLPDTRMSARDRQLQAAEEIECALSGGMPFRRPQAPSRPKPVVPASGRAAGAPRRR